MCRHAGFWWGGGMAGTHSRLGSAGAGLGEWLSGLCSSCCVFSLSISLLFLFPLFAVLLNCPYPNPPVSACFFSFSSAPRRGEGQPRGAFVAGCCQTRTWCQDLLQITRAQHLPKSETFRLKRSDTGQVWENQELRSFSRQDTSICQALAIKENFY